MSEYESKELEAQNHLRQTELRLGELNALLSLIDEPNEVNFKMVRGKIVSYGLEAVAELEGILDRQFSELVQERVLDIIQEIQYGQVYADLKQWVAGETDDLLKGFLIVSQFQYPNLDDVEIRTQIDQITRDVWLEINDELTALEKVKVINHVLFDIHAFTANRAELHTPQNFFINSLLETKKGSPLSLGVLYILIARKLDIPIYGVNLPQHFILAYAQTNTFRSANELPPVDDILFYLNPFNRGTVFTRNEIELFLRQIKLSVEPEYYAPCSNVVIIQRMIHNLAISYESMKKKDKAAELRRLLVLLDKAEQ